MGLLRLNNVFSCACQPLPIAARGARHDARVLSGVDQLPRMSRTVRLERRGHKRNHPAIMSLYSSMERANLFSGLVSCLVSLFPVGTPVSERPPDSSERAQFGHSAPTSGI